MLFFGPLLAQIVTLSVADRTEGRYVALYDKHYEAATRPAVGAALDWQHLSLSLRYSPSFTVVPVESSNRDLLVFHNAYLEADYKWQHSKLQLTEAASYGDQNFYILALTSVPTAPTNVGPAPATTPTGAGTGGAPTAPTGTGLGTGATPPNTTTSPTPARTPNQQAVRYATSTTTVALQNDPSKTTTLRGELSYLASGAARREDAVLYPLVQGPRATASAQYAVGRTDAFASTLSVQYLLGRVAVVDRANTLTGFTDVKAWITNYTETWVHKFDRHTTSQLGVGISGTRSPAANGFIAYSIFPTFVSGITTTADLATGVFSASLAASSAPAIDLITTAVDPRASVIGVLRWSKDGFFSSVSGDSTFSLHSQSSLGALGVVGAGAGLGYQFGKAVSADSGVRVAYQKFEGQVVLPFSQTIYVGLNFGLDDRF